jgi:hypothetical protein
VGGLETYTYKIISDLQSKGIPTVCICDRSKYIAPEYRDIMNEEKITIRSYNISTGELKDILSSIDNPIINIISYHFDGFVWGERLKRKCKWAIVNNFYFLGHFCGYRLYYEDGFKNKYIKMFMEKLMKHAYSDIYSSGALRFFVTSHSEEINKRYGIDVEDAQNLKVPATVEKSVFDERKIIELYRRERFNLLTVSRMEFPHKGYMLGVIDAYGRLKQKYPQLELTIVGDGAGMKEVVKKVSLLEGTAKDDVHIIGTVAPNNLEKYYRDANLNISVAGCCTMGMKFGTLSAPARHYDYSGEVYGFLPEKWSMTTSCEPGIPCEKLIEETLQMSEEEYVRRCANGYTEYMKRPINTPCDGIETSNKGRILTNKEEILLDSIYRFMQKRNLMQSRIKRIKQEGLLKVLHSKVFQKNKGLEGKA